MIKGKCPHCQAPVTNVKVSALNGQVPLGQSWRCISFDCPACNAVLSVQIDPIAIKADIIQALKGH